MSRKKYLIQLIDGNDEVLQLLFEDIGRSEVEKLTSGLDGYLLRELQEQLVDEVRVLDHDRNLLEETVVGDLQVLDVVGAKVGRLVQLNRHRGQAVRLQRQESLACLGGVWKR